MQEVAPPLRDLEAEPRVGRTHRRRFTVWLRRTKVCVCVCVCVCVYSIKSPWRTENGGSSCRAVVIWSRIIIHATAFKRRMFPPGTRDHTGAVCDLGNIFRLLGKVWRSGSTAAERIYSNQARVPRRNQSHPTVVICWVIHHPFLRDTEGGGGGRQLTESSLFSVI